MRDPKEPRLSSILSSSSALREELVRSGAATRLPKSMLNVITAAMKRSFTSSVAAAMADGGAPTLLVGIFQDQCYFEQERARYTAFVAAGTTVVVGYPGAVAHPARGIIGIDTSSRHEFDSGWELVVLTPTLGATLVAHDEGRFAPGPSLERSRLFTARWNFRRLDAVEAARAAIGPLRSRISDRQAAEIERVLRRAAEQPVGPIEDQLATAIEAIVAGLGDVMHTERGPDFSERDLLTGLPNAQYLRRWIGQSRSAARYVALLVDLDNLDQLNEEHGREAGDAAIVTVARGLLDECRSGELLVRLEDDEFLLLATLSEEEPPEELAARYVVGVRALRLPYPFGDVSVTASIGIAVARGSVVPLKELRAALDQAKSRGKNSAVMVE